MSSADPTLMAWFVTALLAATMLVKLMRSQQAKLNSLLAQNVEQQIEWARKKSKATKIAREAAARKAVEEEKAARAAKIAFGFTSPEAEPAGAATATAAAITPATPQTTAGVG